MEEVTGYQLNGFVTASRGPKGHCGISPLLHLSAPRIHTEACYILLGYYVYGFEHVMAMVSRHLEWKARDRWYVSVKYCMCVTHWSDGIPVSVK